MGLVDAPLLGIKAASRIVMLAIANSPRRAGQDHRDGLFLRSADSDAVCRAISGPVQTDAHMVQPGPATHDRLLYNPASPAEGEQMRGLICRMIEAIHSTARYIRQLQPPCRSQLWGAGFSWPWRAPGRRHLRGILRRPKLSLTPPGEYMGLPAGLLGDMRVVWICRREGDRPAETRILIDVLHFSENASA